MIAHWAHTFSFSCLHPMEIGADTTNCLLSRVLPGKGGAPQLGDPDVQFAADLAAFFSKVCGMVCVGWGGQRV
jgi:hypothetical protein